LLADEEAVQHAVYHPSGCIVSEYRSVSLDELDRLAMG
jgi:hypothetical protein